MILKVSLDAVPPPVLKFKEFSLRADTQLAGVAELVDARDLKSLGA